MTASYIIAASAREAVLQGQMVDLCELFRECRTDTQDPLCAFILDSHYGHSDSGVFVLPRTATSQFLRRYSLRAQKVARSLLDESAGEDVVPVYILCKGAVGVERVAISKLAPGDN
jgi:hypothetical protein